MAVRKQWQKRYITTAKKIYEKKRGGLTVINIKMEKRQTKMVRKTMKGR